MCTNCTGTLFLLWKVRIRCICKVKYFWWDNFEVLCSYSLFCEFKWSASCCLTILPINQHSPWCLCGPRLLKPDRWPAQVGEFTGSIQHGDLCALTPGPIPSNQGSSRYSIRSQVLLWEPVGVTCSMCASDRGLGAGNRVLTFASWKLLRVVSSRYYFLQQLKEVFQSLHVWYNFRALS